MAGAAFTTPLFVENVGAILGSYIIKTSEVLNIGELAGINSSGQAVVADAPNKIPARGVVAWFEGDYSPATSKTGDGTIRVVLARLAKVGGFTGLNIGSRMFLGPASTGGANNYIQTFPTTGAELVQPCGYAESATEAAVQVMPTAIGYQAPGNASITAE